ncbi:MAG: hypothetical protein IMZ50_02735 [Candidatus Atribacteria bacterium]|nr:hypothetical protein [Candidatus Atribacteria bacterium]
MTIPTYDPRIGFQASFSCFIGNHAIVAGETVSVLEDRDGLFWLFPSGETTPITEPIAHLSEDDVCKLAGRNIFE